MYSHQNTTVSAFAVLIISISLEACVCIPLPGTHRESYGRMLIRPESVQPSYLSLVEVLESGKAVFSTGDYYPTNEQCESAILKDFEYRYTEYEPKITEYQIVRSKHKDTNGKYRTLFKVLNKDGIEIDSAFCADNSGIRCWPDT